jgi:UPF0716 protein FxsA
MPIILLAFIVVPIIELYVIIKVGESIGVLWTVALLFADSILGGILMRSQGRAVWGRFTEALAAGRMPAREVLDGAFVIFGGAFLLTPGFISDIFGVLLLVPPTRAVIRNTVLRRFSARFAGAVQAQQFARARWGTPARPGGVRPGGPGGPGYDMEGTAREADPPALGRDAP